MSSRFDELARLLRLRRRAGEQAAEDVEEEIRFHLETRIAELVAEGMSEDEARRAALREFGDLEAARRELTRLSTGTERRTRRTEYLGGVRHDLAYGWRRLRRAPGFTAVAVITLALGIGATASIFSVVNGVLLKPLPYAEPERLITVWHQMPGIGADKAGLTRATYFTYREGNRVFEELGAWRTTTVTLTGMGEPERIPAMVVTDGFFATLGVHPVIGRLFVAEDMATGSAGTVVLSYGYWQSRFAGDPGVIGRSLTIGGDELQIIGVLPSGFEFMDWEPKLVGPLRMRRERATVGGFNYPTVARLLPGVTLEDARADLDRLIPLAVEEFPGGFDMDRVEQTQLASLVITLEQEYVGEITSTLWLLLGAVGIVLLIACANVANLFLVRAEGEGREIAVRSALGAGRGRVARELLIESAILAALGGAVGLALSFAGIETLRAIGPETLPRLRDIAIDPHVLAFTLGVSLVAGLAFGLFPVVRWSGASLTAALKEGGRGGGEGRRGRRARSGLVVVQVALALVLLIASGLMLRSLHELWRVDPGFEAPEELLTFSIYVPPAEVEDAAAVPGTHERILREIERIPGVASVGLSTSVTMDGRTMTNMTHVRGLTEVSPPSRRYKFVSENYFETMGIPLLAGRAIDWTDVYERRRVAVVNERFAREYWDDPADAVGQLIAQDPDFGGWREIVGVVGAERDDGLDQEERALVYWPFAVNMFWGSESLVMRDMVYAVRVPRGDPLDILGQARAAVWSVNPDLPLDNPRTAKAIIEGRAARRSFTMVLLTIAAGVALSLGIVGLYGVVAYAVSTRTREIGIRMALGAEGGRVMRRVLTRGLALAAVGVGLGLGAAVGLTRLMEALLFGVRPVDPVTYAATASLLAVIALLASWVPARRAASVDPVEALREE